MAVQNLLAVSLSLGVATASHAWYGWDNLPNSTFVAFESDLIWSEVEFDPAHGDTNVYLATQFYLTNHGGYFGGQFWADGSQHVLFSIWDYNDTVKNAGWDQQTSPWCERFGGEGEGAHCGLVAHFELGRAYTFRMAFRDQNATGDFSARPSLTSPATLLSSETFTSARSKESGVRALCNRLVARSRVLYWR